MLPCGVRAQRGVSDYHIAGPSPSRVRAGRHARSSGTGWASHASVHPGEDGATGVTASEALGAESPQPGPPSAKEVQASTALQEAGEKEPKGKAEAQPFIPSVCLPPVPSKLVAKIIKGDFVDMAELLRDNIEAERQRAMGDISSCPNASRPQRRKVPDFMSWLQCFGTYVAVVANHKPERIKQLMAYQTIMIREDRRCGGAGRQGYDTMFRQLAATTPDTDWGQLNSAQYAVTFMAQQNGRGKNCQYCLETDHCRMCNGPSKAGWAQNPPKPHAPLKWNWV